MKKKRKRKGLDLEAPEVISCLSDISSELDPVLMMGMLRDITVRAWSTNLSQRLGLLPGWTKSWRRSNESEVALRGRGPSLLRGKPGQLQR